MDSNVIQSFARISLLFSLIMHLYTELIFYDGSFEFNLLPSSFLLSSANQSNSKIMSFASGTRDELPHYLPSRCFSQIMQSCSQNRRCYTFIFNGTAMICTKPPAARTMRLEKGLRNCSFKFIIFCKLFCENYFDVK